MYLEKQDQVQNSKVHNLQLEHTDAFKRVIQRAIFHAQTLGQPEVDGAYVLAALLSETESQAYYMLQQEGVNKIIVHQKISADKQQLDIIQPQELDETSIMRSSEIEHEESVIEMYSTNLNEQVRLGKVDPVIGRDKEILRLEQILCRRRKNNTILVGEAGVGKTAIAEGLALQIVNKKIHPMLANTVVYALDLGALLAGNKI